VLVAEDNVINQMVILKMLERAGCRATIVATGQEAITALQAHGYDLVFMDCHMPELDGLEATRRIRSGQAVVPHPTIPIIAMTARALKGDREECLAAGMNDYLAKPVELEEITRCLERWLQKEPDHSPQPSPSQPNASSPAPAVAPECGPEPLVFDRTSFLSRIDADQELAATLVSVFLADMTERLVALKSAVASGDALVASHKAHAIKGAASMIGGGCLQAVAEDMEQEGKSGNVESLQALMPRFEEEYGALRGELTKAWPQAGQG